MKLTSVMGVGGFFIAAFLMAGCGGFESDVAKGVLAVKVEKRGGYDPSINHGRVEKYIVKISAADMEPIVREFSGDTSEGVINDVPTGGDRQVFVEARNENSRVIFEGERSEVRVSGGMNDVEMSLEQVPIFANLYDGSVVHNGRLRLEIFSEPDVPLVIVRSGAGGESAVVDAAASTAEFSTSASSWMASVSPVNIPEGRQFFTITNLTNGRSSSIELRVVGSSGIPAPLAAASVQDKKYRAKAGALR